MFRELQLRSTGMKQVLEIDAVDDIHVVAGISQSVCQPVQLHRVTAEPIGRIKRREVEEVKRLR